MILAYFRSLAARFLHRSQTETELEEELRAHIRLRTDDLERSGLSRPDAERRARIEFGGHERFKEECRETIAGNFADNLIQDVRFTLRLLRKTPAFTAIAVLTLALAVGGTTTIFSVLSGVVLKPLAYPDPEQLVSVKIAPLAWDASLRGVAPEDYFIFREENRTFQQFGIYPETGTDRDVNVTSFTPPERVHAVYVSHDLLAALGIPPLLGRMFVAKDNSPGAAPAVMLSYGYWQRHFAGASSAVGSTIIVDGVAREIVGVLPASFRFLDLGELALILPLRLDRSSITLGNFSYCGIARLKPGVSLSQATADVARMIPITLDSFPIAPGFSLEGMKSARLTPVIEPLKQEVVGNVGGTLWILMSGIAIVLLIACANVANLLLVRTETRQRELTLRVALGATRRRIATQLLSESAVLGSLGSISGLGIAYLALGLLTAHPPKALPRIGEIGIDSPVICFTVALTLATIVLFGLLPALKYSRLHSSMSEGSHTVGVSRDKHRARNVLIMAQLALALVLLICAGLMIRTFLVLTHVQPGFAAPTKVQTFRISVPKSNIADDNDVPRLQAEIAEKLARLPAVESVAFSSAVPMDGDSLFDGVYAADHPYTAGIFPPPRHQVFISPGYFKTLGIPILAGRDLTWAETYNKVSVALISENFAREYWGAPDAAIGKQIRIADNDDWFEIIGVVGNVHDAGLDKSPSSDVYWPILTVRHWGQPLRAQRNVTYALRSPTSGSETLLREIRQVVRSVDRNLPLAQVSTLNYLCLKSVARTSFTLVMLGIAGGIALLLSSIGVYGVIAYSVSQRTQEIGVRMALGAQPRDVLWVFLGKGIALIFFGLLVGLATSVAVTRLISSLLLGVTPTDPLTFIIAPAFLVSVALAACYFPARRAMRVNPQVALRCE